MFASIYCKELAPEVSQFAFNAMLELMLHPVSPVISLFLVKSIQHYTLHPSMHSYAKSFIVFLGSCQTEDNDFVELIISALQKSVFIDESVTNDFADSLSSFLLGVWEAHLQGNEQSVF